MSIPTDRKYSATHEWFKVDGEIVTVGITLFAADELTDVTYVDLPTPGTAVEAGGEFGEIESVKATSELVSAISGEIVEINAALEDAPELVNTDPFGDGWMVRVKPSNLGPINALMDAADYESHCAAQQH